MNSAPPFVFPGADQPGGQRDLGPPGRGLKMRGGSYHIAKIFPHLKAHREFHSILYVVKNSLMPVLLNKKQIQATLFCVGYKCFAVHGLHSRIQ